MVTRSDLLEKLELGWTALVRDFLSLSLEEQEEYLRCQGYPSFSSFLAHINAWWTRAFALIENYKGDMEFEAPPVEVDGFNAAVVKYARNLSEARSIQAFDASREELIDLISRLSDDELSEPRIARQLEIEIVSHLAEHAIKKDLLHDESSLKG